MNRPLRIGTRPSALAGAQARRVASALRHLHPGLAVEIIRFTTRGDIDRRTPLSAVDDDRYFSAELDDALVRGDIDCTVHSRKDLPDTPPAGLVCAALATRDDPRDVVFFRRDVRARLASGTPLRLGSSSTRRAALVVPFLATALPHSGRAVRIDVQPLRGPVDERLARIHLPPEDPDALDGVVLALAGVARLHDDEATRAAIAPLITGTPRMVLPLSQCPAAPGQGVLAVECRADDSRTRDRLAALHDAASADQLAMEQAALANVAATWRDGHGATAITHDTLGLLCFLAGALPDAAPVMALHWQAPPPPPAGAQPFDGLQWQRLCRRTPRAVDVSAAGALFAAYWHALPAGLAIGDRPLWTSGVESWRQLARRGYWVEGCADNLGFAALRATLALPVLGLPPIARWLALTSAQARDGWHDTGIGDVQAGYTIVPPPPGAALDAVYAAAARATHCYWSSPMQYEALRAVLRDGVGHACGAGKTLAALRRAGVDAQPFPNGRAWQRWLG